MTLLYIVVPVRDPAALERLRAAVARPWLQAYKRQVRYWVLSLAEADRERAVLSLAGFPSQMEDMEPEA